MASKHFAVLVILVVGATITIATLPITYPISDVTDPQIQNLGSFAVDEYDKLGESHLIFQMVYGGYVVAYPVVYGYTYYLDIMAKNCTQFDALGNYTAQVYYYAYINSTWLGYLKPKQT